MKLSNNVHKEKICMIVIKLLELKHKHATVYPLHKMEPFKLVVNFAALLKLVYVEYVSYALTKISYLFALSASYNSKFPRLFKHYIVLLGCLVFLRTK